MIDRIIAKACMGIILAAFSAGGTTFLICIFRGVGTP